MHAAAHAEFGVLVAEHDAGTPVRNDSHTSVWLLPRLDTMPQPVITIRFIDASRKKKLPVLCKGLRARNNPTRRSLQEYTCWPSATTVPSAMPMITVRRMTRLKSMRWLPCGWPGDLPGEFYFAGTEGAPATLPATPAEGEADQLPRARPRRGSRASPGRPRNDT